MKRLISFLAWVLLTLTLTAQGKATQRAENWFKQAQYRQAAIEYGKLATFAEKSKKPPTYDLNLVYSRLGECFLYLKEYALSDLYCTKAYEKGVKGTDFLLFYGDALLANEKTDKALEMYNQCLAQNPDNVKVKDRIQRVQYNLAAKAIAPVSLTPITEETRLNATNSQYALTWYKGALMFSSDRTSENGSSQIGPTRFYYTQPTGGVITELKSVKTSAPDHSLAYDNATSTFYVMRCLNTSKGKNCNIYSYKTEPNGKMGKPMPQSFHEENASIGHPTLSSDGKVMFFTKTKDKKSDLFVVKKTGENTWTKPELLDSLTINTSEDECYPQLYQDSILFFSSNGLMGMGELDVFFTKIMVDGAAHAVSEKSDVSKLTFTTPVNLGANINSGSDDVAFLMKQDGRGGYFISNRTTENRNKSKIYSFAKELPALGIVGNVLAQTNSASSTSAIPPPVSTAPIPTVPAQTVPSPITTAPAQTPPVQTPSVQIPSASVDAPLTPASSTQVPSTSTPAPTTPAEQSPQTPITKPTGSPTTSTVPTIPPTMSGTKIVTKVDTVFVDRIKEVYVGGNDQATQQQLTQLQKDLAAMREQLTNQSKQNTSPSTSAQQPKPQTPPQSQPLQTVTPTPPKPAPIPLPVVSANDPELRYRVQLMATTSPTDFQGVFGDLLKSMPQLRLEIFHDADGYYRCVTSPYMTKAEAEAVQAKLKEMEYPCFISTYKGRQRVRIQM